MGHGTSSPVPFCSWALSLRGEEAAEPIHPSWDVQGLLADAGVSPHVPLCSAFPAQLCRCLSFTWAVTGKDTGSSIVIFPRDRQHFPAFLGEKNVWWSQSAKGVKWNLCLLEWNFEMLFGRFHKPLIIVLLFLLLHVLRANLGSGVFSKLQVGLWPLLVPSWEVSQSPQPWLTQGPLWQGQRGSTKRRIPWRFPPVSEPRSAPALRSCPIPPHSPRQCLLLWVSSGGKCNISTSFPLNTLLSRLWLHQNTRLGAGPNTTRKWSSLLAQKSGAGDLNSQFLDPGYPCGVPEEWFSWSSSLSSLKQRGRQLGSLL